MLLRPNNPFSQGNSFFRILLSQIPHKLQQLRIFSSLYHLSQPQSLPSWTHRTAIPLIARKKRRKNLAFQRRTPSPNILCQSLLTMKTNSKSPSQSLQKRQSPKETLVFLTGLYLSIYQLILIYTIFSGKEFQIVR